jgi:hypothetical protein
MTDGARSLAEDLFVYPRQKDLFDRGVCVRARVWNSGGSVPELGAGVCELAGIVMAGPLVTDAAIVLVNEFAVAGGTTFTASGDNGCEEESQKACTVDHDLPYRPLELAALATCRQVVM